MYFAHKKNFYLILGNKILLKGKIEGETANYFTYWIFIKQGLSGNKVQTWAGDNSEHSRGLFLEHCRMIILSALYKRQVAQRRTHWRQSTRLRTLKLI